MSQLSPSIAPSIIISTMGQDILDWLIVGALYAFGGLVVFCVVMSLQWRHMQVMVGAVVLLGFALCMLCYHCRVCKELREDSRYLLENKRHVVMVFQDSV